MLTPSDVSSLPTPPCPQANTTITYPPFGLDNAFCAGDDGFRSYDHACCTYERWRDADELYRECQERNKFNAFRDYWWVVFLLFQFFSSHFLIYRSLHQPNRNPKTPPTVLLV